MIKLHSSRSGEAIHFNPEHFSFFKYDSDEHSTIIYLKDGKSFLVRESTHDIAAKINEWRGSLGSAEETS